MAKNKYLDKEKIDEMILKIVEDDDYSSRYKKYTIFWEAYEDD